MMSCLTVVMSQDQFSGLRSLLLRGWVIDNSYLFPKIPKSRLRDPAAFFEDSRSRLSEIEKSLAKKSWRRRDLNRGPEDGDITKRMFFHRASWPRLITTNL